jgi:hypothetical protein
MLISRRNNKNVINSAIEKACLLDRKETVKKKTPKQNDWVVLVVTYNPKLPSDQKTLDKYDKRSNNVKSVPATSNDHIWTATQLDKNVMSCLNTIIKTNKTKGNRYETM